MSIRRLWVLVSRLPHESSTQRALRGEEAAEWTPLYDRLTDICDHLILTQYAVLVAAGAKPKKPDFMDRPRFRSAADADAYAAEMAARAAEIRARKQAERDSADDRG